MFSLYKKKLTWSAFKFLKFRCVLRNFRIDAYANIDFRIIIDQTLMLLKILFSVNQYFTGMHSKVDDKTLNYKDIFGEFSLFIFSMKSKQVWDSSRVKFEPIWRGLTH